MLRILEFPGKERESSLTIEKATKVLSQFVSDVSLPVPQDCVENDSDYTPSDDENEEKFKKMYYMLKKRC